MRKHLTKQQAADQWYSDQQGQIDWSNKHNRDTFRLTTIWKKFQSHKKKFCECCTLKSPRLSMHHLHPGVYDDLNLESFRSLCPRCHKTVTILSQKKDWSNIPDYWKQFLES